MADYDGNTNDRRLRLPVHKTYPLGLGAKLPAGGGVDEGVEWVKANAEIGRVNGESSRGLVGGGGVKAAGSVETDACDVVGVGCDLDVIRAGD